MSLVFKSVLLTLLCLAAGLLVDTLRLPNPQVAAGPAAPALPLAPDSALAHLVSALRIPTVSRTG